uniref:Ataxin 7 like 1 n=1 Tax=Equus asinus TaxID=9793 RepID=A0A9L0KG80_EQUAS
MTSERSRIPCLSAAAAEGTGKKQQEGRAMATLDRKVPSPEAFLGKPWSSWIDAAKLHCSDNVDLEEAGKEGGKSREVMRLNKEAQCPGDSAFSVSSSRVREAQHDLRKTAVRALLQVTGRCLELPHSEYLQCHSVTKLHLWCQAK